MSDPARRAGPEPRRRVLVIDDEEGIRSLLDAALSANGYGVQTFPDAEQALAALREAESGPGATDATGHAGEPDVAVVDIRMPGMDGLELSRELRARDGDLPVIIMTAHADMDSARDAIRLGAYDYIAKPFDVDDVLLSVARAAERRALLAENRAHQRNLEARVEERTRQLSEAMSRVEQSFQDIQRAHLESIFVLSRVTELNDEYTGNHIRRVSAYCEEVARALGCSTDFVEQITYSSPMHDIGKISIPPEILGKPGKLTPDEFAIVKQHAVNGARILKGIPFLTVASEIALTHHERYDGTGYPRGLKGEDIPLSGRIVAVADVFDALISRRPYKEPYSFEQSLEIMAREAGKHFDPRVLGVFLGLTDRVREIAERLRDEADGEPAGSAPAASLLSVFAHSLGGGPLKPSPVAS
ncbi:MAG TPA: HD domain-containing phosphohydrolase [Planctomycetota bacterium]|nr:HD domain-containing phosphohydrolase [Planctomycetota bacterium]